MSRDYWSECVAIALEDARVPATTEQIELIAGAVESAHQNYGMAMGHDCIPNPLRAELDETKRKLELEQRKTVCRECDGHGSITTQGPYHSATSQCDVCRGEGKV